MGYCSIVYVTLFRLIVLYSRCRVNRGTNRSVILYYIILLLLPLWVWASMWRSQPVGRSPLRCIHSVTMTASEATRLYWQHMVKLHGVPRAAHTDRGAQFVGRWWPKIWTLLGTKLKYKTAYQPQNQGQVERMNAVISQTLQCLMSNVSDLDRWREYLPTMEMVVNSFPNRSTEYNPFYLMYRYHPVLLVELLKGDESTNVETLVKFWERTQEVWRRT